MQFSFEELIQIIRAVAQTAPYEFLRVVLASSQGEARFIEVSEDIRSRTELQYASREGLVALGLLGWELKGGMVQAKSMLFPWHRENRMLGELFDRLCEEGVDRVQEGFERHQIESDS
ncbi:hypothetical protein MYX78_06940 [Acidobacteria bacterium AH-259-G07]|nr:hypothetical protein [Acidobacteria bacterium AH-259-G07]